jgi:SAM-dependent methyltransferase
MEEGASVRNEELYNTLKGAAAKYPDNMVAEQMRDIPRIAFNISLALDALYPKQTSEVEICDLGGGIGLFSLGCAAYGLKRTVLVDDFDDEVNRRVRASILELHRGLGVEVVARDVVGRGIQDIAGSFDAITTFDSMEHWHHSPRKLFHQVMDKLKPGGVFVLGVPNCVNLRKRIAVPLGFGKWSRMQDWYEPELFRGHTREPDVGDLKYIAKDMGLSDVRIYGRNWLGYDSPRRIVRIAARAFDHPLRIRPSLCSDIYLVGVKRGRSNPEAIGEVSCRAL